MQKLFYKDGLNAFLRENSPRKIAFIFGIIVTLGLGIHADGHSRYAEAYDWTTIICGFCVSLLNGLFLLFLSRIGKAVDDIRNKYVS